MRTEEFKNRLQEAGATWTSLGDHPVVRDYGDYLSECKAALAPESLIVADRSERETVVALGADAVPLIQGLVTGNVFLLAQPGAGQYNMAVNVKGRFVTDMRLLHIPEMLLIDFEPGSQAGGVIRHLRKNVINEDAKFLDRTERTGRLTVLGERATDAVEKLGLWDKTILSLRPYHGTWGLVGGHDVIVQENPNWGLPAYDLYLDTSVVADVWKILRNDGATPAGNRALEALRICNGVPRFGVELDANIIPLEADLGWAVSFDKGCYLGQEIIARLDTLGEPKQMLRKLTFDEGKPPMVGSKVEVEGKQVGKVRSAVTSPISGKPVALAYIKRGFNEVGGKVAVGKRSAVLSELRP